MNLNLLSASRISAVAVLGLGLSMGAAWAGGHAAAEKPEAAGLSAESKAILEEVLAGDHRSDKNKARDAARNPMDTLAFFGVEADMNVVEVWPGAGWYTEILAPYVKRGGGTFTAAHWDTRNGPDFTKRGLERYKTAFSDKDLYGDFEIVGLSDKTEEIAPEGSVDVILTFRNLHNWMPQGTQDPILAQMYKALKPGGVLGVLDHRAGAGSEGDLKATGGYVNEDLAIEIVEKAGFKLDASSDVNNNPKDTADHEFGVWTLPPTLATARFGEDPDPNFDQAKYKEIGESDRFTLRFVKPE